MYVLNCRKEEELSHRESFSSIKGSKPVIVGPRLEARTSLQQPSNVYTENTINGETKPEDNPKQFNKRVHKSIETRGGLLLSPPPR